VLQCVAVCRCLLYRVAACCSVLQKGVSERMRQCVAVHCSAEHRVAACCSVCCRKQSSCSVLQCVAACIGVAVLQYVAVCRSMSQYVGVCCSVSQCVAMCRILLQCVPACCIVLQRVLVCCRKARQRE